MLQHTAQPNQRITQHREAASDGSSRPVNAIELIGRAASRSASHAGELFELAVRIDKFADSLIGSSPRNHDPATGTNKMAASDGAIVGLSNEQDCVDGGVAAVRNALIRLGA